MSELLVGKVQAGFGDAARWLKLFNAVYSQKPGMSVFLGSLNIALDHRRTFLWMSTTAARDRQDPWVVEIVADVNLREHFALQDGDVIEIRVPA